MRRRRTFSVAGEHEILEAGHRMSRTLAAKRTRKLLRSFTFMCPSQRYRTGSRAPGMRPAVLGLGVVEYTPNPVGRMHPGVGHARKPGDPFRTWTIRRQSRQK